jgi:hypothetical protein
LAFANLTVECGCPRELPMLTVEELLVSLTNLVRAGVETRDWNVSFISSVAQHVHAGRALTINQGKTVVKLASNHIAKIATARGLDASAVKHAIAFPSYRTPPVESANIKREVRYLGGNKLAFRFKMDPTVVAELKGLKSALLSKDRSVFNQELRIWVVSVSNANLEKLFAIIKSNKFEFDDDVLQYMLTCSNSKGKSPTFKYDDKTGNIVVDVVDNPILEDIISIVLGGELL